ncbi:MAG TPA: energy transducer TonB [Nitrososphaera sp.]|nr:energy transducer TonB [Nitrososphaera sp.]
MRLSFLTLISMVTLAAQCSRPPSQVSNHSVDQPQQASPSPTDAQKKECDFSLFKPFKIGLMQAPAISMPKPTYPPEAKEQKIEGKVIVKILINVHSGEVEQACVVEGSEILAKAARDAALQIKFSPDWGNNKYLSERYKYLEANMTYNFVAQ